jgi:hypothetical protein
MHKENSNPSNPLSTRLAGLPHTRFEKTINGLQQYLKFAGQSFVKSALHTIVRLDPCLQLDHNFKDGVL